MVSWKGGKVGRWEGGKLESWKGGKLESWYVVKLRRCSATSVLEMEYDNYEGIVF